MATNQPSLSELTNIQGNAEQGGSVVAEIKPSQAIAYLQHASAAKGEADKYIYEKFQENLKTNLATAGAVDMAGLSESDYPELSKRFIDYSKKLADNYEVVGNPNSNLQMFSELKKEEADLRTAVAQSKQQNVFLDKHREFLNQHPEWNTDANIKKLDSFSSLSRDQRQVFTLDAPMVLDVTTLAKAANEAARKKVAEAKTNGTYIRTMEGTTYEDKSYNDALKTLYNSTGDKYGHSVKQLAKISFDGLDEGEKTKYGNDPEKYFLESMGGLKNQDSVDKTDIQADQWGLTRFTQSEENGRQARRLAAEKDVRDETQKASKDQGSYVNTEAAKIFLNGSTNKKKMLLRLGPEQFSERQVNNIAPGIQKMFSKNFDIKIKNEDEDAPKKITSRAVAPDAFTYTSDGQLRTVFYMRDDDGNIKTGKGGNPAVDVDKTSIYSADQVRGTIAYMVAPNSYDNVLSSANDILFKSNGSQSMDSWEVRKNYGEATGIIGKGTRSEKYYQSDDVRANRAPQVNPAGKPADTKQTNPQNTATNSVPSISSKADYDALPKGSTYISNGQKYIKK